MMKAEVGRQKDPVTGHRSPVTAFVALGSNLADPPAQIRSALRALAGLPVSRLIRRSSLYRNPPEGGLDQPDFVNAVAEIETRLGPHELLARLLEIERAHGRARGLPRAPRTLDLDIVLFGGLTVREPDLAIPHPRMLERAFVMAPLAEVAPEAVVPGHGRVADLARKVDASGMIKLAEPEGVNRDP
jgi:2-amino-4-hydroxy-6-hydroxymethyldihydropteridine diphosphokinase